MKSLLIILLPLNGITQSYHSETTAYQYDNLNRLIQVIYPDGSIYNYVYDNLGNRIQLDYSYSPPVGVSELTLDQTFKLYPNPTTNEIIIEIPDDIDQGSELQINISDMKGTKVVEQVFLVEDRMITLKTENMEPGTYIVSITSNGDIRSLMFVKE